MIAALPRLLLGGTSGLLLVLSLPKPDLYPLAWLALVPLLAAAVSSPSYVHSAAAAYTAGVVYFAGTCYWIGDTMTIYGGLDSVAALAVAALFVVVLSLYFAAFGAALHYFVRRYAVSGLILAPPLWVALEFLRTYVPFGGFPWMLSGYALVPYPGVLQIAAWTGVYGLSFLAAAVNTLIAIAVAERSLKFLVVGVGTIAVSWLVPVFGDAQSGTIVNVRIVQTNISFDQSWEPAVSARLFDDLGKLSAMNQTSSDEMRLIVWPESTGPFFLDDDPQFRDRMQRIARDNGAYFLFGYVGMTGDLAANSAAAADPRGNVLSRYDKIHLVPFGEYVPLKNALFFAEDLLKGVGSFAAGTEYTVSLLDNHPVSTVICYESIFPGLVREFVRFGSELIVVITNDGWFGDSSAPYQHLRMAVVRAVENRRYVVRSANTGISAIIDPYGRIEARTAMNVRTSLDGTVRFRTERTFYTIYGDVFAWLNIIVLAAGGAYRGAWKRPLPA